MASPNASEQSESEVFKATELRGVAERNVLLSHKSSIVGFLAADQRNLKDDRFTVSGKFQTNVMIE